jgi:hypothetical protein
LVVVALSAVGLIGFLAMQKIAVTGNSRSRAVSEATALAQDRLEQYSHVPYVQLAVTTVTETGLDSRALAAGAFTPIPYTRITDIIDNGNTTFTIQVRVNFTDEGGGNHTVTIKNVRAN